MTQFSISGQRNGHHITVIWNDGKLSGDDAATIAWIEFLATLLDGTTQGQLGGPYTTTNHLASPYTARMLIRSVFAGKTRQSGHLPPLDGGPAGAIQ